MNTRCIFVNRNDLKRNCNDIHWTRKANVCLLKKSLYIDPPHKRQERNQGHIESIFCVRSFAPPPPPAAIETMRSESRIIVPEQEHY